jgi:glycosyltransferase involved in cell wall biosynthesis
MTFRNLVKYLTVILSVRPNLVYMPLAQNTLGFSRDAVFIVVASFFSRKTCVHFHGGNFDLFYASKSRFFRWFVRSVMHRVDSLIVLADQVKTQFVGIVDLSKITVVYNSVPVLAHEQTIPVRSISKPKNTPLNILFIGYLSKAKGAVDLVSAIPILNQAATNQRHIFVLCGHPVNKERNITFIPDPHGGYDKILAMIAAHHLEDQVTLMSAIDDDQKHSLLSSADIFVFPTYSEGCGLVVMEALAYGLPIITTRAGALGEILREGVNCLFVDPGDVAGIASAIQTLANDPDLRLKMSKYNRALSVCEYSKEKFIDKLAGTWLSLLEAR